MESSRATKVSSPDRLVRFPRPVSGEKAAVQGDKMGKIAVKAASRMFRVSPPSTSSLRPRRPPVAAPSQHQPVPAASTGPLPPRSTAPRSRARPFGLPACPAPSHHFSVIPRIAPGVPVSVVSRHVSRATGKWTTGRPLPASGYLARRCAPPERNEVADLTRVMDTRAQLQQSWEGGGSGRPRLCMNHKHSS